MRFRTISNVLLESLQRIQMIQINSTVFFRSLDLVILFMPKHMQQNLETFNTLRSRTIFYEGPHKVYVGSLAKSAIPETGKFVSTPLSLIFLSVNVTPLCPSIELNLAVEF